MLPLELGTRPGFDILRFFSPEELSRDIAVTDGALLRSLVRESFEHDPILLAAKSRIQLYFVLENMQAGLVDAANPVTPMVVFASHTLPYRGIARYGMARWEQGRFAKRVI